MAPESCFTLSPRLPALLHDPLIERGFALEDCAYRRDGLSFAVAGQWYVLSERASEPGEWSLSSCLSQVGLWKRVRNGPAAHRVFEIPSWAVRDLTDDSRFDDGGPASFASLLDWALESRSRRVPPEWQPPARDLIESWMPRGGLTVQADGTVRQGELIVAPERWALRTPILPRLPGDLPEIRRRALQELVFDAQSRWAMVRLGIPPDPGCSVLVVEVDLTGAPHSELLFSAGLDVLRHVVAWLVETADVLADPSVVIECLAQGYDNTNPNERNQQ